MQVYLMQVVHCHSIGKIILIMLRIMCRLSALQFIIYGSYYAVISLLFLIRGTYTACVNKPCPRHTEAKEPECVEEVIAAERL